MIEQSLIDLLVDLGVASVFAIMWYMERRRNETLTDKYTEILLKFIDAHEIKSILKNGTNIRIE